MNPFWIFCLFFFVQIIIWSLSYCILHYSPQGKHWHNYCATFQQGTKELSSSFSDWGTLHIINWDLHCNWHQHMFLPNSFQVLKTFPSFLSTTQIQNEWTQTTKVLRSLQFTIYYYSLHTETVQLVRALSAMHNVINQTEIWKMSFESEIYKSIWGT